MATSEKELADRLLQHAGDRPKPSMATNMEYAHPGTRAWVERAVALLREAHEALSDPESRVLA